MTLNEDEYYVHRIAGRKIERKKTYYLIEWDGYELEANTWESEKNLLGNTELVKQFETTLQRENSSIPDIVTTTRKVLLQNTLDPDIQQPVVADARAVSNKRKAPNDKEYLVNLPQKLVQHWSKIMKRVSRKDATRFLENLDQSLTRAESLIRPLLRDRNDTQYFKGAVPSVTVVNNVDDEPFPTSFKYINSLIYSKDVNPPDPAFLIRCECTVCNGSCHEDSEMYAPDGTLLVEQGSPIYECNSACGCPKECRNRIVQRGRTVPLQIFKTKYKGWGVKAMDSIKRGQFVEEYLGEVITEEEGEFRGKFYDKVGMTYLFDMDFGAGDDHSVEYVIDSFLLGNASHFFNHSCEPNLSVYAVYHDSANPDFHRLAFFARRDIKKGEELTIDYQGGSLNPNESAPRGRFECRCESATCRKWIHK
ncbi:SET domain-containing protein [Lichtheimia hyalospora FSU 10163]|nr:SET domain-containing protein [Lichtheimia hyalospora FSU 10163]